MNINRKCPSLMIGCIAILFVATACSDNRTGVSAPINTQDEATDANGEESLNTNTSTITDTEAQESTEQAEAENSQPIVDNDASSENLQANDGNDSASEDMQSIDVEEETGAELTDGEDNSGAELTDGEDSSGAEPTDGEDDSGVELTDGEDDSGVEPTDGEDNSGVEPTDGEDNSGAELADVEDNSGAVSVNEFDDALQITINSWDETIDLSYTFANTSDSDVILFAPRRSFRDRFNSTVLDDGTFRAYSGKYPESELEETDISPPTVEGLLLVSGDTLQGRGTIVLPDLEIGQPPRIENLSSLEVCVGFSVADDIRDLIRDDGFYEVFEAQDKQRFTCQTINKTNRLARSKGTAVATQSETDTETGVVHDDLQDALKVDLLSWTETLEFLYTFKNTTDSEVVVFDPRLSSLDTFNVTLLEDGTVRLFSGRFRGANLLTSYNPILINGLPIMPGDILQGSGSVELPIVFRAPGTYVSATIESPESVEICIGFSRAEDVVDKMVGNGTYELEAGPELQLFACQTLSAPD